MYSECMNAGDTETRAHASAEAEADRPQVIPSVELTGSRADKLRTLDAAIARLQQIRNTLTWEALVPPYELHGRYINAPVWPWFVAGWIVGALFVVVFLVAWSWA